MRTGFDFKAVDDVFSFWDSLFKDLDHLDTCGTTFVKGMSPFPPADVIANTETKELVFKFAVAGVPQEKISVDFENDFMFIKIDETKEELGENEKFLHSGIKKSKSSTRFLVPAAKYKQGEAKATMKDGILTVRIPASEEQKAKKIIIEKD